MTRRNDRRLRTSSRGWVVNGDVWSVLRVHSDGAADARRHRDGSTITLPADYLAEHTHLGYATTAHRAQGMTVDICHAAINADTSHELLYVAATRGRNGNHLWVVTDSNRDVVRDPDDLPAPEQILSRILERQNPDRLSAHQAIQDSLSEMTGLARLGQVFEDTARTATDQCLRHLLTERGLGHAADDPQWPTLVTAARQTALAGYDLEHLMDAAIQLRPIDDAESTAAVLHWRLHAITDHIPPVRPRGPLASLPDHDGPVIDVARQAGELMRQRWRDIRAALAEATDPLPWAPTLGPPPIDTEERSAWLTAATAVTAYRERYEIPDHADLLGPRPAASRPDAQAAWEHARYQADRYLAQRLRHLTHEELVELDARQLAVITNAPRFDPAELEQAQPVLDSAEPASAATSDARAVTRFEHAAQQHRTWRRAVAEASAIRRQIALEQQTRHRHARWATMARSLR